MQQQGQHKSWAMDEFQGNILAPGPLDVVRCGSRRHFQDRVVLCARAWGWVGVVSGVCGAVRGRGQLGQQTATLVCERVKDESGVADRPKWHRFWRQAISQLTLP